jgi:hypothetical protein
MLSVKYMGTFICAINRRLSESDCRTLIDHLEVLTYMSIREEWKRFVVQGELFVLAPLDGDPNGRTVVLSLEMHELLTQPMEEGEYANRRSRLLATLHNIVAGRRLVVCMEPFEARKANIGRLCPIEDSVFDIRCQDKPAVRVFCRFLEKNVLFVVTCRPRSVHQGWLGWFPLGGRRSKAWKQGIAAAKREWDKFFPTYPPVKGGNLDDYLSSATLERARRGSG